MSSNSLTQRKQVENELDALLQSLSLSQGNVNLPTRKAPGANGNSVFLNTNMYQLQIDKGIKVYRYDVKLNGRVGSEGNEKFVNLTKCNGSSAVVADKKNQCRKAFNLILETKKDFFENSDGIYYDLQSMLYTLHPLNIPPTKSFVYTLNCEDEKLKLPGNLKDVTIEIQNVHEQGQIINLDHLSQMVNENDFERDRSLLNFIELAVNIYPAFNENEFLTLKGTMNYLIDGAAHSLPEKEIDRNGTKYLASGVKKSALLIEGYKDKVTPENANQCKIGLVVSSKHAPFHSTMSLFDYVKRHSGLESLYANFVRGNLSDHELNCLDNVFKGLQLDVQYSNGNRRKIAFEGFHHTTAKIQIIDDLNVTVNEYYLKRYGPLNYSDAHLVKGKCGPNVGFYPPELLSISDNQIVKVEQLDAHSKKKIIKNTTIRPDKMQQENQFAVQAIHLHKSTYSSCAGIKFSKKPLEAKGRVLSAPSIQYGTSNSTQVRQTEAAWKMEQFYRPANFNNFAVYMLMDENEKREISENQLNSFVSLVKDFGTSLAIQMGECEDSGYYKVSQIAECIEYCCENKIQFCIFITPDHMSYAHDSIKFFERQYSFVVTQELKLKTLRKMMDRDETTLQNIFAKINIKMGGLNFKLTIQDRELMSELENTMFIGICTNQPGTKSITDRVSSVKDKDPGVLGYCANYGSDKEFLGDFEFITAYRSEFYPKLRDIFALSIKRYIENRKQAPSKIIFYYNGISESEIDAIYKYAIPLIKQGIFEANNNIAIPLTILAVQKKHNVCLFPKLYPTQGKDHQFNVSHGTVVDTTIVSPVFSQFYLEAHSTLVGTGCIPRYTVMFDESDYSMDKLEGITHVLSYEHQITSRATSLPTVTHLAEEFAKRGRSIYNAAKTNEYGFPRKDNKELDLEQLSKDLNYKNTSFWNKQVNA